MTKEEHVDYGKKLRDSNASGKQPSAKQTCAGKRYFTDYKLYWFLGAGILQILLYISIGLSFLERPEPFAGEPPGSDSTATANPPSSAPARPEATKEALFLQKTIGAIVKISINPSEKTPVQLFFEKLLRRHPRESAKGRWIDKVPCTRPSPKPAIKPELPTKVLYNDQKKADGHWPAFCKRNPKTAAYLKKHMTRPFVRRMPRNYTKIKDYLEHWECMMDYLPEGDKKNYFEAAGSTLLYADYLISRGDANARALGMTILRNLYLYLDSTLIKFTNDPSLCFHVGQEIAWPAMDPNAKTARLDAAFLFQGIICQYKNDYQKYRACPDFIRLAKWVANRTRCGLNFKELMFTHLSNAYGKVKDYLGMLMCLHAEHFRNQYCKVTLGYMKYCFVEEFGKEQGAAYFREYLSIMSKISTQAVVKNTLLEEEADVYAKKRQYKKAIECLQQLDPKGKNRKIQQKIKGFQKKR